MAQDAVTKPKHAGGRPSKYRKEYCQRAIDLGKEGKTLVYLANELIVTKSTVQEWASVHPEFSAALAIGKSLAEQWLLERARERQQGQNAGASDRLISWMLSAAHGYREASDVNQTVTADVTHKGSIDVNFVDIDPTK